MNASEIWCEQNNICLKIFTKEISPDNGQEGVSGPDVSRFAVVDLHCSRYFHFRLWGGAGCLPEAGARGVRLRNAVAIDRIDDGSLSSQCPVFYYHFYFAVGSVVFCLAALQDFLLLCGQVSICPL